MQLSEVRRIYMQLNEANANDLQQQVFDRVVDLTTDDYFQTEWKKRYTQDFDEFLQNARDEYDYEAIQDVTDLQNACRYIAKDDVENYFDTYNSNEYIAQAANANLSAEEIADIIYRRICHPAFKCLRRSVVLNKDIEDDEDLFESVKCDLPILEAYIDEGCSLEVVDGKEEIGEHFKKYMKKKKAEENQRKRKLAAIANFSK